MDVVYNHKRHHFWRACLWERLSQAIYVMTTPPTNQWNLSAATIASRAMVRYRAVGRFNSLRLWWFSSALWLLMGIFPLTAKWWKLKKNYSQLTPNIYLYGEGWKMDTGLILNSWPNGRVIASQLVRMASSVTTSVILNAAISTKGTYRQRYFANNDRPIFWLVTFDSKGAPHFVRPRKQALTMECHDNATFFDYSSRLKDQTLESFCSVRLKPVLACTSSFLLKELPTCWNKNSIAARQ